MVRVFLNFLIFSNVYVAFPVAMLNASTFWLFNQKASLTSFLFIYFGTLSLYSIHRIIGLKDVKKEYLSERHLWALRYYSFLNVSSVLSTVLSIYFLFQIGIELLIYSPPLIVSFLYTIPILKTNNRYVRLRDIPGIKSILISLTVSYLTVIIPSSIMGLDILLNDVWLIFCQRFLFILAITIPFDIRDYSFDLESNLKSLPILLGIKNSKTVSITLLGGFLIIQLMVDHSLETIFSMLIVTLISSLLVVFSNARRSEFYFSYLLEGTMILYALGVFMNQNF